MTLSADAVRDILLSAESTRVMADRYGVSRQSVSQIRLGRTHTGLFPEIPRREQPPSVTCRDCCHWQPQRFEPCDLGHPDPVIEGVGFASWCASYQEAKA